MAKLTDTRVAILATDGFEYSELASPRRALEDVGATTHVVSPIDHAIRGWADGDWSQEVAVDRKLTGANPKDYDALVLPGGVINPDQLRLNEKAVAFVRAFVDQGKPIGAICHGPWTLINAKAVARRKMTSWPSLRCDLENAGAQWIDQEVVVDEGLVTSRKPDDLPAFNAKLIEEIAQGRQRRVA
jgi:protease I